MTDPGCALRPDQETPMTDRTPRERWGTCCPNDPECEHSLLDVDDLVRWMDTPMSDANAEQFQETPMTDLLTPDEVALIDVMLNHAGGIEADEAPDVIRRLVATVEQVRRERDTALARLADAETTIRWLRDRTPPPDLMAVSDAIRRARAVPGAENETADG